MNKTNTQKQKNRTKNHSVANKRKNHPKKIITLGILPLRNIVVFPGEQVPLIVKRQRSLELARLAWGEDRLIGVITQKDPQIEDCHFKDLYSVGVLARIVDLKQDKHQMFHALIESQERFRVIKWLRRNPYLLAQVEILTEKLPNQKKIEPLLIELKERIKKTDKRLEIHPPLSEIFEKITHPGKLADLIALVLPLPHIPSEKQRIQKKQEILETVEIKKRLNKVLDLVRGLEVGMDVQEEVGKEAYKKYRVFYLQEQMKAIQKELRSLGEEDGEDSDIAELRTKIKKANLPKEAKKAAEKELERLAYVPPAAAEYTVIRSYLDWLIELPWNKSTQDNLDLVRAEKILNQDHYNLEKVKKRILEYLAVRKLKADMKGPILCFVGPPGTGKTSLGKSIARALNRKFVRIALGGVKDEAEIRGHRRTYIGALPGRIIQQIKRAGANNPVFMIDEIDKIGTDWRGDPSSALLEVLDPEQNHSFSDHYLEVPFDLSKVMFIATANVEEAILPALRDRMEILHLSGYTSEEKLKIAQRYLVPRQLAEHGLKPSQLKFNKKALQVIIQDYTREAGVRNLEREIANICRKVAKDVVTKKIKKFPIRITQKDLPQFLGPAKYFSELAEKTSKPGVAVGLAWTPYGGEIMFVEATLMKQKKGNGGLTATGHLGKVMKESIEAVRSYIWANAASLKIDPSIFENYRIHLHVPSGAVPKDGPSAGLAIFIALVSLLTNRPTRPDVAMSGEITLRGRVLPVGGIKEKVLAAKQAGIKTIILPEKNKNDLEEIIPEVRKKLNFKFVREMKEVVKLALVQK